MREIGRSNSKAARPVGDPGTPDPTTISKSEVAERQAIMAKLRDLMGEAREGDESAAVAIRKILDSNPDLAWRFISGPGKIAQSALMEKLTKNGDLASKELLEHQLESMRIEVAGENPSPLERLLAERVAITWLQMQVFEAIYTFEMKTATGARGDYLQKCIDRTQRRHLSAIKALAQIRKLGPAVQINIAEKQINTAS